MNDMWRPIDSAPRDGTEVLLYYPKFSPGRRVRMGSWWSSVTITHGVETRRTEKWMPASDWGHLGLGKEPEPTQWMPVPPEPM